MDESEVQNEEKGDMQIVAAAAYQGNEEAYNANDIAPPASESGSALKQKNIGGEFESVALSVDPPAEGESKSEEKKQRKIEAMKQRSIFSLSWTIADKRCFMIILQLFIMGAAGLILFFSLDQKELADVDVKCESDAVYSGPYKAQKDDVIYGCSWPDINYYLRLIVVGIAGVTSLCTILMNWWCGKKVLFDIEHFNGTRKDDKKIEYFDVYSIPSFRWGRKLVGYGGYLQFIVLGMDITSYLSGREALSHLGLLGILDVKQAVPLEVLLYIEAVLAVLLRLSHDSMYQRLYKRKALCAIQVSLLGDKDYQGTTVHEKQRTVITMQGQQDDDLE